MRGEREAYIGARLRRREDARLLTGRGTFVDDIPLPGVVHAAFVRSPHAHARILGIDTRAARALPGVLAAVTARDVGDVQKPWPVKVPHARLRYFPRYALPLAKVRYVGEPLAVVVATSRYLAEDARDLVDVTYAPCPRWPTRRPAWRRMLRWSTKRPATTSPPTSSRRPATSIAPWPRLTAR